MKRYALSIGLCYLLFTMNACKHESKESDSTTTTSSTSTTATTSSTATTTTPPINDSVCFNTQILPLFNSSCAMSGCHDAVTHADGYNFTSYTGIMRGIVAGKPTNGKIMHEIENGSMPLAPLPLLPADQKALLVKWITEGAQNRICTGGCDPANATFSAGVNPIIKTNCVGCHNNNFASGGVHLNGYTNIKTYVENGKLLCSIQHGGGCSPMPQNAAKLSDPCIALIQNWINNGTLDN